MTRYFYECNGAASGPVSAQQLQWMLLAREIAPTTRVRPVDDGGWMPLRVALAHVPPPNPAQVELLATTFGARRTTASSMPPVIERVVAPAPLPQAPRIAARAFDTVCVGSIGVALASVALRAAGAPAQGLAPSLFLSAWLACLLPVAVLPWSIAWFATTPGKALMGISVLGRDGAHLSLRDAFVREAGVLTHGLAFGVPGFAQIAALAAAWRMRRPMHAPWDHQGAYLLRQPKVAGRAIPGAIGMAMFLMILPQILLAILSWGSR